MFKQSRSLTRLILLLALIGVATTAYAQSKGDFTLTLRGKWRLGNAAEPVAASAFETGSFPLPANLVERKK